jgi:hypothetical protein
MSLCILFARKSFSTTGIPASPSVMYTSFPNKNYEAMLLSNAYNSRKNAKGQVIIELSERYNRAGVQFQSGRWSRDSQSHSVSLCCAD